MWDRWERERIRGRDELTFCQLEQTAITKFLEGILPGRFIPA
jgi:hypothetical protein